MLITRRVKDETEHHRPSAGGEIGANARKQIARAEGFPIYADSCAGLQRGCGCQRVRYQVGGATLPGQRGTRGAAQVRSPTGDEEHGRRGLSAGSDGFPHARATACERCAGVSSAGGGKRRRRSFGC